MRLLRPPPSLYFLATVPQTALTFLQHSSGHTVPSETAPTLSERVQKHPSSIQNSLPLKPTLSLTYFPNYTDFLGL